MSLTDDAGREQKAERHCRSAARVQGGGAVHQDRRSARRNSRQLLAAGYGRGRLNIIRNIIIFYTRIQEIALLQGARKSSNPAGCTCRVAMLNSEGKKNSKL